MSNINYLEDFLAVKELEGCSAATIENYRFNLSKFLLRVDATPTEITTQQIRRYLADYKRERGVSNCTLDNMRRVYSSFFHWMHQEGYVLKDPCAAVNKIKTDKTIKQPFSDEEMEILRDNCKNERESAIIEILYSSGMRVGELAGLDKDDIDQQNGCAMMFGKGSKEREVYFTVRSQMALKKYLDTRHDDSPSLFIGLMTPHKRLQVFTYEKMGENLILLHIIILPPFMFRKWLFKYQISNPIIYINSHNR